MQAELFDQTMTALVTRRPFRPFTIALVNGDRFEVDFPTAISVRAGTGVFINAGGIPVIFDHEGVNQILGDLKGEANA